MRKLIITLCAVQLAAVGHVSAQALYNSFETTSDYSTVHALKATTAQTTSNVTNGTYALQINLPATTWPTGKITPATPWELSQAGALACDVTNTSTTTVALRLSIYDSLSTSTALRTRGSSPVNLAPGQTATVYKPFVAPPNPMDYGMPALPPDPPGYFSCGCWGSSPFDFSKVAELDLYTPQMTTAGAIVVDNVRSLARFNPQSLNGIVDKYGQSSLSTWTGKAKANTDLTSATSLENTWLTQHPKPTERDAYGGWNTGPMQTATGYFRTAFVNGKWWLVTPRGSLFFSTGIDGMSSGGATFVDQRAAMFQSLPASTNPNNSTQTSTVGPESTGTAFDFYGANLATKYGTSWATSWTNQSLKRLLSWGFNTVGCWSDPAMTSAHKAPYVLAAGIYGTFNRVASAGNTWGNLADPFDPNFASAVTTSLRSRLAATKTDPWLIGYFVENEPSWGLSTKRYSLAYGALAQDASWSPAKREFVAELQTKYLTTSNLNTARGTSFSSWTSVNASNAALSTPTASMQTDMSAYLLNYARAYFRTISTAFHSLDPNHLYLGCRFSSTRMIPEAIQAASDYSDEISLNLYTPSLGAD